MTKSRLATIDLGTNTFHLLIVEKDAEGRIVPVYRERQFVHLGEGGLGHIRETAMQRGWSTLSHFQQMLHKHRVVRYRAIGTSALREADNADVFMDKVREMDIHIEVIDGLEEARLIHRGVQEAMGKVLQRSLIMDIGGGSVEMILSRGGEIEWSASFRLGVAVLYEMTGGVDPVTPEIIELLSSHIRETLTPLTEKMKDLPPDILVGASGSFEVLEAFEPETEQIHQCSILSEDNFHVLYEEIIASTLAERLAMPAIPKSRAQLIIVALILIREILRIQPFEAWLFSPYALKEGVLTELG